MSEVIININDRTYQIRCDDGQEDHVKTLAAMLDERVRQLVSAMGQIGDQRLLVMAGLLLADDLSDAKRSLVGAASAPGNGGVAEPEDDTMAFGIEELADRIETVARRLEQP